MANPLTFRDTSAHLMWRAGHEKHKSSNKWWKRYRDSQNLQQEDGNPIKKDSYTSCTLQIWHLLKKLMKNIIRKENQKDKSFTIHQNLNSKDMEKSLAHVKHDTVWHLLQNSVWQKKKNLIGAHGDGSIILGGCFSLTVREADHSWWENMRS